MLGWLFTRPRHGASVRADLAKLPPLPIAEVVDGTRTKITGTVVLDEIVTAPLSGRACGYWMITIDEVGLNESVERGLLDGGVPFLLDTSAGRARVLPDGARVDLPRSSTEFPPGSLLPPRERAIWSRLAPRFNYPNASQIRFTERVLPAGLHIHVAGLSQREPDRSAIDVDNASYRGDLPTIAVFSGSRRHPLWIGAAS